MRIVVFEDEEGWHRPRLIRDDMSEAQAHQGIPVMPDLNDLDWEAVKKDLNNLLVARGIFTYNDLNLAQGGLSNAILSVMKKRVVTLYRENSAKGD